MPNRIIKESICTSESLDRLSYFQECFFYRLITQCDDYGCFDARPRVLAAKCFPLKDVRVSQIEDALRAMTSEELVILYEVDGKPFGQMKSWDRHQQIRAKRRKYPAPPERAQAGGENVISNDITCNQMQSFAPVIQSNPNPNPNPNTVCVKQCSLSTGEMKRPSLWEVEAYCTQNGYFEVDPKKFMDYQMMNGWKNSHGQPIEDWQAALRLWAANEHRIRERAKPAAGFNYEQRSYTQVELDAMLVNASDYLAEQREKGMMCDEHGACDRQSDG